VLLYVEISPGTSAMTPFTVPGARASFADQRCEDRSIPAGLLSTIATSIVTPQTITMAPHGIAP
jgi:hypothetical protein